MKRNTYLFVFWVDLDRKLYSAHIWDVILKIIPNYRVNTSKDTYILKRANWTLSFNHGIIKF